MAAVLILDFVSFELSERSAIAVGRHLLIAVGFLWLYLSYIKPADHAVDVLSDFLREHGETLVPAADPLTAAESARDRLDRYAAELKTERERQQAMRDDRLEILKTANQDLLTHHRCTKKMLQSSRSEEVFEVLLKGVRDGLGFPGAVLGILDRDGELVFHENREMDDGSLVRIPAWTQDSLLARALWSGEAQLCQSLKEHPHLVEERTLLGEGASFLLPVYGKQNRKCAEVKGCGNIDCSSYASATSRCWTEHSSDCTAKHHSPGEDDRKSCIRCEMFGPVALLAIREIPGTRNLSRESIVPVAALANEASIALDLVELYENLRKMSITDGLTGLFNHREFYQQLRRELERARRYRHTVSLLLIDVDDFKRFNDRFGHLAGDLALRKIADLLRNCARATDIVARYGGEEFAVILPESTAAGALMLAERIKTDVGEHNFLPQVPGEVHLTVSIGIYTAEEGAVSEDQLVGYADQAAYSAKGAGKNRVVVKSHA